MDPTVAVIILLIIVLASVGYMGYLWYTNMPASTRSLPVLVAGSSSPMSAASTPMPAVSTPMPAVSTPVPAAQNPVPANTGVLTNALPASAPPVSQSLPPSVLSSPAPKYLGCYKDTQTRAMSITPGVTTWDACATAAKSAGAKYFGMQWPEGSPGTGKANCFYTTSTDPVYQRYGTSTNCNIRDNGGNALGGVWSNSVYQI
jgi:hypothetical protein